MRTKTERARGTARGRAPVARAFAGSRAQHQYGVKSGRDRDDTGGDEKRDQRGCDQVHGGVSATRRIELELISHLAAGRALGAPGPLAKTRAAVGIDPDHG
jgi:hypothetical protein